MSTENPAELEPLYAAADLVSAHYGNDTYQYSGPLNGIGFAHIVGAVLDQEQRPNCLLILTTNGGDLSVAYQIARFLHSKYSRLFVCTPGFCRSAGTLVALGAHKILADEYSEFGPIDGQIYKSDESIDNGLGALATFEFGVNYSLDLFEKVLLRIQHASASNIRLDVATELSLLATHSIMHPCFSGINLGEAGKECRNLSVAMAYGKRLADHAQNMREGAVEKLVKGYPSHDFIIDYAEAQALFSSIEKPAMALYRLLGCLDDLVYSQQNIALVRRIQRPRPQAGDSGRAPESSAVSSRASDQASADVVTKAVAKGRRSKSEQARRKPKKTAKGRKNP